MSLDMFWKIAIGFLICSTFTEGGDVLVERLCERIEWDRLASDLTTQNVSDGVLENCSQKAKTPTKNEYFSVFDSVATFLEPAAQRVGNPRCRNQLYSFLNALKNSSLWAVQMFDASAKIPQGLVSAETFQLGNYDECVEIDLKRHPSDNIFGKYCLPYVQFAPYPGKYPRFHQQGLRDPLSLEYNSYDSAWEKFLIPGIATRLRPDIYRPAVCVPNECQPKDVEDALFYLYNSVTNKYGVDIHVKVPENACSTNEVKSLTAGASLFWRMTTTVVTGVLLVSAWDLITRLPDSCSQIIESLSICRNMSKLITAGNNDEFLGIHGAKVILMALIIMGHRVYLTFAGPIINRQKIDEVFQDTSTNTYAVMLNGPILVDTFLVITGFLVCIRLYEEFLKNPKLKFRQIYFIRWLRLTPVYTFVVLFYAYILDGIGNGPMWKERVGVEAERCRQSWWINLLYINNYVGEDNICMIQSWYVAVDFHYILFAPIIVLQLVLSPKKGLKVLLSLIVAAIVVPFCVIYFNRLDGALRVDVNFLEDHANDPFYTKVYIKTHTRAVPYLMGLAAGFFYVKMKERSWRFTEVQLEICLILTLISGLWAYFSASIFYTPGRKYDALESATVGSLRRFFWAASSSFVLIAFCLGQLSWLKVILFRKIFVPLGRLSYLVLLVHPVIQMYILGILRTADYVSFPRMIWMTTADLAATYFAALVLYLFIEAPFAGLMRLLMTKKYSAEKKPKNAKLLSKNMKSD